MRSPSIKNTARNLLCWALIGGMTAMAPVSHAAAESYRRSDASSETRLYHNNGQQTTENSPKETTDSTAEAWFFLGVLAVFYLLQNGIGGGSDSDGSSPGWLRQDDTQPSNQGSSGQDNGVGCFWGYDSTGTCVR